MSNILLGLQRQWGGSIAFRNLWQRASQRLEELHFQIEREPSECVWVDFYNAAIAIAVAVAERDKVLTWMRQIECAIEDYSKLELRMSNWNPFRIIKGEKRTTTMLLPSLTSLLPFLSTFLMKWLCLDFRGLLIIIIK